MDEAFNKKIFEESAKEAIVHADEAMPALPQDDSEIGKTTIIKTREQILAELQEAIDKEGSENWDRLAKAMNGPFAKRMLDEMHLLSGKEFVRTYMKLMEYFRPKITRIEGGLNDEEEKIIRVEVINSQDDLQRVIDAENPLLIESNED